MSRLKEKRETRRARKADKRTMKQERKVMRDATKKARLERRQRGEGFFGPKGTLKSVVETVSGVTDTIGSALDFGNNAGGYIESASDILDTGRDVKGFFTGEGSEKAGMSGVTKLLMIGVIGYAVVKMFTGKKTGIKRR